MKIKLSDYVFQFFQEKNIDTIFSVAGGAAAHLLNSVDTEKFKYINCYHEQACAMAAEGYARISNKPAIVLVTNGPGSTNTITGVTGAYQDSIPMIIISGNVPLNQSVQQGDGLRQLGVQELDIIPLVENVTKYAIKINLIKSIKFNLEAAYFECMNGRKGPVWLDIPLDVQNAIIDTDELTSYIPPGNPYLVDLNEIKGELYEYIKELIRKSKRPLIITGNGIHLAQIEEEFKQLVNLLGIPVVSTWTSKDLFNFEDPLFIGNFGLLGERAANFAVQNADLLIILGSRLSIPNIGYKSELFSPDSVKVMVDIDYNELDKHTLNINHKVYSNLKDFIPLFIKEIKIDLNYNQPIRPLNQNQWRWLKRCQNWKKKYPTFLSEYKENKDGINSFYFSEILSKHLKDNHIVVTDMGTAYTCIHQSLKTNGKNRLFTSSACCSMGWGLPGAIGAYFANPTKEIILIAGDGGFQMNIQELQTIKHYNIPIKIFILNNNGYLAISLMQDNLFEGKYIGSTPESGVSAPNFCKVAEAYGIGSINYYTNDYLEKYLHNVLDHKGPYLVEIKMQPNQILIPRVQSIKDKEGKIISTSLENMFPFLPEDELKEIMTND